MARRIQTFLKRGVNKYIHLLETKPYTTQIVTSTIIWAIGDYASQRVEGASHKETDWQRVLRCGAFGLVVAAPVYTWWYPRLDRFVKGITKAPLKALYWKVVLDQAFFEPTFLAASFVFLGALEGKNLEQQKDKLRKDFWQTFLIDCAFWIPSQFVNFWFCPVKYQALLVNTLCVGWNGYVSHVEHKELIVKQQAQRAAAKELSEKLTNPQPLPSNVATAAASSKDDSN
jgi:hypothetical protein